MKVLLHICCGPCAIYPVELLRREGWEVEGFFYNPNIHPFSEYNRRLEALVSAAGRLNLNVTYHKYDFHEFLKKLSAIDDRDKQHVLCWGMRLEETARAARQAGIGNFTTTLLVSPYQNTEEITLLGKAAALRNSVNFLDKNFVCGFSESHKVSKSWGLYHQKYCGCLYSEKESAEYRNRKKPLKG